MVERTFKERSSLPGPEQDGQTRSSFFRNNSLAGAAWVISYLTPDGKRSFCIYEAPDPEAIRQASLRNNLPIDRISEIHLLDPYTKVEL
jgi:hypothetical protein